MRILSAFLFVVLSGAASRAEQVWLEQLDLGKVQCLKPPMGYPAKAGRSVADKPITIKGVVYPHGVGTHSGSKMLVNLNGQAEKFTAAVGVDDAQTALPNPLPGSAVPAGLQNHLGTGTVEVWVDGKPAADTGMLRRGVDPKELTVDLAGAKRMLLIVTDGGRWPYNNPVDLANAAITMKSGRPEMLAITEDPLPPVASVSSKAALHGASVIGGSPGRPFLYRVPASGARTMRFGALNLPAGLKFDRETGFISGVLKEAGTTHVQLVIVGQKENRELTIVSGNGKLALTPPLGWNSWNVWARAVDDKKIRQAADAMVKSGLAAHGYQYINIDDAWMGARDASGEIHPNEKFPDMKALADYVHSKGLKIGIYSSPGPLTCQKLEGSFQHEAQDAATYAKWGMDFLKYDLCSYRAKIGDTNNREQMMKPYRIMGDALKSGPRDMVFSLCQYGLGGVEEWGPEVGGQLWRTTGDIRDSWESMSKIGFEQAGREKWAGPGRWNDPDMLVVGMLGWGVEPHQSRLNGNEQLTHITLWSLLSAPLLLGCDMSQFDPFTVKLLTNDEVLDVNQDPAGKQAGRRAQEGLLEVWAKPLSDGTVAAGLFNRGIEPARVTAKWSDLGLSGKQPVRDLWQQKSLGVFESAFAATVPAHGAVLVKIGQVRK